MNLSGFKTQDNAWAKLLERGEGEQGEREGAGQRECGQPGQRDQ